MNSFWVTSVRFKTKFSHISHNLGVCKYNNVSVLLYDPVVLEFYVYSQHVDKKYLSQAKVYHLSLDVSELYLLGFSL